MTEFRVLTEKDITNLTSDSPKFIGDRLAAGRFFKGMGIRAGELGCLRHQVPLKTTPTGEKAERLFCPECWNPDGTPR